MPAAFAILFELSIGGEAMSRLSLSHAVVFALSAGWKSENPLEGEVVRYRLLADQSTPERAAIEVIRESPMNEIYGSTSKVVMTFDLARGLVEQMTSENTQTYGFNGQGKGTTQ